MQSGAAGVRREPPGAVRKTPKEEAASEDINRKIRREEACRSFGIYTPGTEHRQGSFTAEVTSFYMYGYETAKGIVDFTAFSQRPCLFVDMGM